MINLFDLLPMWGRKRSTVSALAPSPQPALEGLDSDTINVFSTQALLGPDFITVTPQGDYMGSAWGCNMDDPF